MREVEFRMWGLGYGVLASLMLIIGGYAGIPVLAFLFVGMIGDALRSRR